MSDFDRLLSLAEALARGETVDQATDAGIPSAEAVREKPWSPEDLERLVAVLRRIDQTERDLLSPLDETSGRAPGRWAHLAIISTIGHGPVGTVYRAYDPRIGVEVKLELLAASEPAESVNQFLDAGRRLVRLHHPNVIRCYGVDQWAGCAGMWTEVVKGATLEDLVRAQGPMSAEEAATIGRALCHAAAVIHQAGVADAVIAPRNVVRDGSGRVVLTEPLSRVPEDRTVADVVRDIIKVVLFLATGNDNATAGNAQIAAALASVIEQASSTQKRQRLATLDALESALAKVAAPGTGASGAKGLRRSWRALTAWAGGVIAKRQRP